MFKKCIKRVLKSVLKGDKTALQLSVQSTQVHCSALSQNEQKGQTSALQRTTGGLIDKKPCRNATKPM